MNKRIMIFLIGSLLLLPTMIIQGTDADDEQPLATSIDVTLGTAPTVDGVIGTGEWTDASSVSIAQTSGGPWVVYYKHTLTDIYFAFTYGNGFITDLCFDVNNDGGIDPQTDDYKLHSSMANYEYIGTGSDWNRQTISGWSVAQTGMVNVKEYRVSFAKLGITSGVDKTMGIMFHILANPSASDGNWPSGANTNDPSTWGTMSSSDLWGTGVPLNDPPTLENGFVDPTSGSTDEEYIFSVEYYDENDDVPTISQVIIDGTPYEMTTDDFTHIDGSLFTYTTYMDDNSHSFHFLFNDSKAEARFPEAGEIDGPVVITPNTAPELIEGGIPNGTYSIEEDSGQGDDLIDLEEYFEDDRDDGNLRFEIIYQESPSKLLATIDGSYLDVSQQQENWFGDLDFQVKAIDLGLDGVISGDDLSTESNSFMINVTPVNDDPVIERVAQYEITDQDEINLLGAVEDEWFNFTVIITDADIGTNWDESISFPSNGSGIWITPVNGGPDLEISYLPTQEDVGWKNFNLKVEDSHGGETAILINIEVSNSNDAPYIDLITIDGISVEPMNRTIELAGSFGGYEGEYYNFTILAKDDDESDEEDLHLSVSSNTTPLYLVYYPDTWMISILPEQENIGTIEFHIIVTDRQGASDTVRIVLEVSNTNDPPITPTIRSDNDAFVFSDDDIVNLRCLCWDPDLDIDPEEELLISWSSDIDGDLFFGDMLATSDLSIGNHTIMVTVKDAGGLISTANVLITIMEMPELPVPEDIDPNATGGEVKVEKEEAPVGLIVFIVIIGLILLAGVVVLVMMIMKKKDASEEKEEVPEETPEPILPQDS